MNKHSAYRYDPSTMERRITRSGAADISNGGAVYKAHGRLAVDACLGAAAAQENGTRVLSSSLWSVLPARASDGSPEAPAAPQSSSTDTDAPGQQPGDAPAPSQQQPKPEASGQQIATSSSDPSSSASENGGNKTATATASASSSANSDDEDDKSKRKPVSVVKGWGIDITGVVLSLLTTALAVTISLQWNDAVKHLLATSPWAKKMNRFVVALILTIIGVIITVIFAAIARAVGTTLPSSALSIPARTS